MTTTVDPEAESIIGDIREAFLGVRRGEITLHEAEVLDDYGSDEERKEARKIDTDGRWERVPDSHLEECTTALCHVDAESWRYYIAPYMIWSLRYFRTNCPDASHVTIFSLSPSHRNEELREYAMERYRLLNEKQARCVCRFLRYMARDGGIVGDRHANQALRNYWGRFCEPDGT